ncbi:regulatory protein CII [Escherichia coli]|nr:regulatory protein CII [Escherichia coli]
MQPLTYQQTSGFSPTAVINRSQTKQAPGPEKNRDAVPTWSAAEQQDVLAPSIFNEKRGTGAGALDFLDDICRRVRDLLIYD